MGVPSLAWMSMAVPVSLSRSVVCIFRSESLIAPLHGRSTFRPESVSIYTPTPLSLSVHKKCHISLTTDAHRTIDGIFRFVRLIAPFRGSKRKKVETNACLL